MKSLSSYQGSPTWWDDHPITTGLVRTLLFFIGIAPVIAGVVYWLYLFHATGHNPNYRIVTPSVWVVMGCVFGAIVWAFIPINAAIDLNT